MKAKRRKNKVHESNGISIREIRPEQPEGGGGYFQVDVMRNGKRERRGFPTLARAKTYCQLLGTKIDNEGTSALSLTPAQRQDAVDALARLAGRGALMEAADFWARHNGVDGGTTVAELGRLWLVNLRKQGCRPTTMVEREHKVERLVADIGDRVAVSVTRNDIEAWLTDKGLTGATWDGYRRAYRAMFQFGLEERLVEVNPVASIKAMRMDERLPTPFSVDAVKSILATAEKWSPQIVPTLAVQFFAGLRPGEALGLLWTDIDFKGKTIRVRPEISKVRRSRILEKLNPVLFDWLTPYRKASGPIGIETPSQFNYYVFRKPIGPAYEQEGVPIAERKPDPRPKGLAAAAGVPWIQDGGRKTFATMHFATHGDAGKTMAILGHTGNADIFYKHYRGLATKAEARRYWAIRPASASKGAVARPVFKKAVG